MTLTFGQQAALEQLQDVEATASGLLTLEVVKHPTTSREFLEVKVGISCVDLQRNIGGLPLRDFEYLIILIPPTFPFDRPAVMVEHRRFAGFPHVQWTRSICLYQAPSTEWNSNDGMFGFLDRLYEWLKQGALGQLDPVGAPLHPPVTYLSDGPQRTVVPRVNCPPVGEDVWYGTAHLRIVSDVRVDITGWTVFLDSTTP